MYEFRNLPIAFDDDGDAFLVDDRGFRVDRHHDTGDRLDDIVPDGAGEAIEETTDVEELEKSTGEEIYDINIDPVTRVAGALAFHAKVDLEAKTVEAGHSQATRVTGSMLMS